MEVKPGDIIAVDFPFSDGSDTKRRPALVLSGQRINQTGDIIILQITSRMKDDGLSMLLADKDLSDPLPLKSFVRLHKIFTVDKNLVVKKLTRLNNTRFNELMDEFIRVLR